MNPTVIKIVRHIGKCGGAALVVGGAVRDKLMGVEPKDIDLEVYFMTADQLEMALLPLVDGKIDAVGKSFGVLKVKIDGQDFDISLPRRESKEGKGHKGFMVEVDHRMRVPDALARRDYTINAMAFDVLTNQLIDPHDGETDLRRSVLRHTSDHFGEDPLRVLRGMQFAGRFGLAVDPDTAMQCLGLVQEYKDLPIERIWTEWWKWATKSTEPSFGIRFLMATDWTTLYPEIHNLYGVQQDNIWHPEGCVMAHTLHVCDAMAEIAEREKMDEDRRGMFMLAALCHDMGKPAYTKFEDGRWRSRGHEQGGVPFADSFLTSIGCHASIKERILPLVGDHLAHQNADKMSKAAIRRLARRLAPSTIADLVFLIEADTSGRPPLPKECPESAKLLLARSLDLGVEKGGPAPILLGRHLIQEKICSPGPEMGRILKAAFEAQIDDAFIDVDGGLAWVKTNTI